MQTWILKVLVKAVVSMQYIASSVTLGGPSDFLLCWFKYLNLYKNMLEIERWWYLLLVATVYKC